MNPVQSREEIIDAFQEGLVRFSALVRPLTDQKLATPSRCEGWTVGDVAADFVGSIVEIAAGEIEGQGTPPVTKRQVEVRKGRTGAQLADELDQAAGALQGLLVAIDDATWNAPLAGFNGTMGQGVEALVHDGALHADDIDHALNLGHHPTAAELLAVYSHVACILDQQGWGPATLALDGMPELQLGEGGTRVTGNAGEFVLAATGRGNPAAFGLDDTVNIYR